MGIFRIFFVTIVTQAGGMRTMEKYLSLSMYIIQRHYWQNLTIYFQMGDVDFIPAK